MSLSLALPSQLTATVEVISHLSPGEIKIKFPRILVDSTQRNFQTSFFFPSALLCIGISSYKQIRFTNMHLSTLEIDNDLERASTSTSLFSLDHLRNTLLFPITIEGF